MNASTRAHALRAAAKAALSVSLVGCGGATVADTRDNSGTEHAAHDGGQTVATRDGGHTVTAPDSARDADAALRSIAEAGRDGAASETPCTGLPASVDASVSTATFACCLDYLAAGRDASAGLLAFDASSPANEPCCTAIIAYVDDTAGAYAAAEPFIPACCEQTNPVPIGRACTPWGPPVPPAMPPSLLEVA